MNRRAFPGISHEAFSSDADRRAREALEKLPLLPQVIRKFHEMGVDRWMYSWNMAMSIRCGRRQYPTLQGILEECCAILDMPVPELYVANNPFPNAFAGGVERPYITVRSSMIDTLSDDQLYHLIGHELGHIKCGHVLYYSIARVLMPLLDMLGRRTLGVTDAVSMGLVLAFLEWSRQAELTCDRAGLLCSQQFELSATANMALCAGPSRLAGEASLEAFLDQSRTYQEMSGLDAMGKFLVFMLFGLQSTHPMPVHRTQELEKWFLSGAYENIMNGHYQRAES